MADGVERVIRNEETVDSYQLTDNSQLEKGQETRDQGQDNSQLEKGQATGDEGQDNSQPTTDNR
jgi:hypothetical protein